MIIGVCGKAGSGKDTIANHLVKSYSFQRIALADPVREVVKHAFGLDEFTVCDRVEREKPLEYWDNYSVRQLLQFVATELFRDKFDKDIWVKTLWSNISKDLNKDYVISDVRFPNETNFLRNQNINFKLIKVVRDGCDGNVGISGHESEKYDLDSDCIMYNNTTIDDLNNRLDKMLLDLK